MKTLARIAAVAVAAVALAACSAMNPITTNEDYQASDGVTVKIGDSTKGINLLVVTTAKDAPAVLTGALHNSSAEDVIVTLSIDGEIAVNVTVPARSTVALGPDEGQELVHGASPAAPGGLAPVWFATEIDGAEQTDVPVMDGTLPEYQQVVDSIPALPEPMPTEE